MKFWLSAIGLYPDAVGLYKFVLAEINFPVPLSASMALISAGTMPAGIFIDIPDPVLFCHRVLTEGLTHGTINYILLGITDEVSFRRFGDHLVLIIKGGSRDLSRILLHCDILFLQFHFGDG